MNIEQRKQQHIDFWNGRGGSLLFIPAAGIFQYDVNDYKRRFYDPAVMLESELEKAQMVIDWPTDGLPAVRSNLGTIFIPAIAGQDYMINEGQMPWPGEHFSAEQIAAVKDVNIEDSQILKLALELYNRFRSQGRSDIFAYHADTQGVFDVLHLLRGNDLFYEMSDEENAGITHQLLDIVTKLYIDVSKKLKASICEADNQMVHGHGTPQGLYFPSAGVRLSEDTATLLSPAMIDEFVIPYMHKAAMPFGGAFVHYCGKHEYLYEAVLNCHFVRAIDLGNPEMYDTNWLLKKCAQTSTVFYGKLAELEGEKWPDYTKRIASIVKQTGARCVLRPCVFPQNKSESQEMLDMWHELTM